MVSRRIFFPVIFVAAGLALAACHQSTPVRNDDSAKVRDAGALVAAIQAAGTHDDSIIRVKPLRQPGVEKLLSKAKRQESTQRYEAAADTLDKALKISPKAPDILQDRAELAVRLGDYSQAEKLARRSFKLGPQVGSLCARNWQTVLEMRRIAKDPVGVQNARKALADCEESGPVRM